MKTYLSKTYKKTIKKIASKLKKEKKSVLVTGACGLIGSCIVDVFLEAGYNVFALDLKKNSLLERFGEETDNLHFVIQNICEPLNDNFEFDYIVHAASFADPKSYALFPVETMLVNVVGTNVVLDYAKSHSKTRVLITSTFEVYGKLDQDAYSEEDYGIIDFNLLRSCYPESKRVSEILIRSYYDEYRVNGLVVRLSSIYGPTMLPNDSKAHAQFLLNGINKRNIVLKSKGEQTRTYTYVMDAVAALIYVLLNGESGEVYNVANKQSIVSIAELAKRIAKICEVNVVFDSPDALEAKGYSKPQNCILSTDKITKLGWEPSYDLESGLLETIAIMKESMK